MKTLTLILFLSISLTCFAQKFEKAGCGFEIRRPYKQPFYKDTILVSNLASFETKIYTKDSIYVLQHKESALICRKTNYFSKTK